ncbi:MAG: helix-turn-helix transcriptional regulator [Ectothiorhodospiraceae bacterium]|nr:helix-turn-helix transcriptional regulator [Ectothiorhodospiraceae bacterium]
MVTRVNDSRLMVMGRERVFYLGLLGVPSQRALGAYTLYSGLERSFSICIDGVWQSRWLAMMPPGQPHRIRTEDGLISAILLEPETVDAGHLHEWAAWMDGVGRARGLADRIRSAYARLRRQGGAPLPAAGDLDRLFFGRVLTRPDMDPRVAQVVRTIQADPRSCYPARDCAAEASLSFSRFLHLFKQETGVSFRKFRAWKRARSVLFHVNRRHSMTEVALEAGYPDAAHFSRCVRQVYGLCPSEIFSGSRRMPILLQADMLADIPVADSTSFRMASNGA